MQAHHPTEPTDTPARGEARSRGSWLIVILGLGFVFGAYAYNMREVPAAFTWREDFEAALTEAQQKSQLVLLEFHTQGCPACRWMDQNVFSESDAARALEGWVPVHIDGERELKLSNRYEIEGYPTVLALTPEGEVIAQRSGTMPIEDFVRFLNQASKKTTAPAPAEHDAVPTS